MKTKFNGFLTLLLALVVQLSFAQEKTVSGTVSDNSGSLPGVSVTIKGTSNGTETDFDGKYTIKAKPGAILSFSFVGFTKVERTVGLSSTINVTLEESSNVLDEVVVVGYGTSTKQSFTGSAKVVKSEELEKKNFSNISNALAGEVAGVNVIASSGQPGSSATIRIRGFGSVNGNRAPLYVVDGVPFTGAINSINPSDVQSTTVLKDATATAIYGARGANGVILITTKSGKNGVTSMEVDVKTGVNFSGIPRYDFIRSPEEYIGISWQAMKAKGELNGATDPVAYANANLFSGNGINAKYNLWDVDNVSDLIDPSTGEYKSSAARKYSPEFWGDYAFQTSYRQEVNFKMSGGNDKTKYFSSFGYLDDEGYTVKSNFKRYTTRLNLSHTPTKWLKANVNLGYSVSETQNNGQTSDSGSIFWFTDNIPVIYPLFLRDEDGNKVEDEVYGGYQYDYGVGRNFGTGTNSIGDATYNSRGNKRHSLNGNVSFTMDLAEGLVFETTYGLQYNSTISNSFRQPFYGTSNASDVLGSLSKGNNSAVTQNFLQLLRYKKEFGDHSFEVLAAHESNQWDRETSSIYKTTVVNLNNSLFDLSNYIKFPSEPTGETDETRIESYFGQLKYNYQGKYFLTGSIRRDGSSRFSNQKWGTFGSAGISWLVNRESFFENVDFVDFLKVKASYGLVGDQAGVGFYSGQNTYAVGNLDGNISLSVQASQNPDLTWETSKMFQTGLEVAFLNNRISANIDYYIKDTNDLVFDRRIGPSVGDALLTVNDGALQNSGLEFDIDTKIINKKDFGLSFAVNGAFLKNKLTKMPIEPATGEEKLLDIAGSYGRSNGSSLYDFYMREWAGVDPSNGDALWVLHYHDENGNGVADSGEEINSLFEYSNENPSTPISQTTTNTYADATEKYIGKSAIPKVNGAFRINARIKNFDISTQFRYSLGGYSYDSSYADLMSHDQAGSNNYSTDMRNRWMQPGDVTDVPRVYSNENIRVSAASSRFVTSSNYIALNNLRVGYKIPQQYVKKAGLSGVNLWLSGDNLFLLSKRTGFNPMTSETGSSQRYNYAPLSTFTMGVRVKF